MNPGFRSSKSKSARPNGALVGARGYVHLRMIDESMDTEQMKRPPQPWEFHPACRQRLIIMLGGIIVNLILGFAIYSMVLLVWGETVLPATHPYGLEVDERLKPLGKRRRSSRQHQRRTPAVYRNPAVLFSTP